MEPLPSRQRYAFQEIPQAEGEAARGTRHHRGAQVPRTFRQDVFGGIHAGDGEPAAEPEQHAGQAHMPDLTQATMRAIDEQTKFDGFRPVLENRLVGALPGIAGLVAGRMTAWQAVLCGLVTNAANAVCACGSTGGAATARSKAVLVVSLLGCFSIEVPLFTCAAPGCETLSPSRCNPRMG